MFYFLLKPDFLSGTRWIVADFCGVQTPPVETQGERVRNCMNPSPLLQTSCGEEATTKMRCVRRLNTEKQTRLKNMTAVGVCVPPSPSPSLPVVPVTLTPQVEARLGRKLRDVHGAEEEMRLLLSGSGFHTSMWLRCIDPCWRYELLLWSSCQTFC